ncbi:MAG TPA: hypothetical protein VLA55_03460, partial [Ornithinibacter sp.]|nr:hypothetical protein [Ornithinibacter sp.]
PGAPGLRPALGDLSRAGDSAEEVVAALDAALSPDPGERPGAHELAWLLFEAATATPLDLVRGGDEISAVTYRLRAAAGVDGDRPGVPRRRLGVPRRRLGVPRRRGRHTQPVGRWPSSAARVAAPALGAVALTAAIVLAVTVLGRDGGTAVAAPVALPSTAEEVERTPSPTPTTSVAHRTDPRRDPDAPADRASELLTALAEARAAAWREATPAMLHGADAAGSAAASRDAAAIAEVARAGLRYAGLRYSVADAHTVSATRDAAVVRARIDASAYTVVGPSGSQSRPASVGDVVLVELVRTDEGWRIADLRSAT